MSDHAVIVCEISTTAAEAPARANAARRWLLARRIVEPNDARDALWHPSEFRPGPRATEAALAFARDESARANNGVDVVGRRAVHHPIANYEPTRCPQCDAPGEDTRSLLEAWLEGEEPEVECAGCTRTYRLGDAAGRFNAYVAEVAVRFNNWPELGSSFVEELGRVLGPRWRVVHERL